MSNRESLQSELDELLRQLNNLRLQQRAIQDRIPEIVAELGGTTSPRNQRRLPERVEANATRVDTTRNETPVAQRVVEGIQVESYEAPRERFYTDDFQPRVNDEVRILNPKPWQGRVGTIQGFTRDGKLKVYTRNRQVIQRLPKNVVCTRRNDE